MNYFIIRLINKLFGISVRCWSILSLLLVNYFVVHILDAHDAGVFLLLFNLFFLSSIFARFGADTFLVKLVSRNKGRLVKSIDRLIFNCMLLYFFCSVFVLFFLLFFHKKILEFFTLGIESPIYFCFVFSIPFSVFSYIVAFYFQGVRKFNFSVLCLNFVSYTSFLFTLLVFDNDLYSMSYRFLFCNVLSFAFALCLFLSSVSSFSFKFSRRLLFKLYALSVPFFVYTMFSQLIIWGGQLIASSNLSPEDFAGYSIAHRISQTLSVILMFLNFFFMPRFAMGFKERNFLLIQNLCQRVFRLLLPLSLLLGCTIIYFSNTLLSIFGEHYSNFKLVLILLVIAQVVNLLTGSVGYLLSMSGNQLILTKITGVFSISYLILAYCVSLVSGVKGLAFCSSIFVIVLNFFLVFIVYRKTGINTLKYNYAE